MPCRSHPGLTTIPTLVAHCACSVRSVSCSRLAAPAWRSRARGNAACASRSAWAGRTHIAPASTPDSWRAEEGAQTWTRRARTHALRTGLSCCFVAPPHMTSCAKYISISQPLSGTQIRELIPELHTLEDALRASEWGEVCRSAASLPPVHLGTAGGFAIEYDCDLDRCSGRIRSGQAKCAPAQSARRGGGLLHAYARGVWRDGLPTNYGEMTLRFYTWYARRSYSQAVLSRDYRHLRMRYIAVPMRRVVAVDNVSTPGSDTDAASLGVARVWDVGPL